MEPFIQFGTFLLPALEPVALVASLIFSGLARRDSSLSRKIENQIRLADGYRDIWTAVLGDEKLNRVREKGIDLTAAPVTPAEDRLVRFVFQNVFIAFEARRHGQLGNIGDLEKDVADFLSRPIPRAVWQEMARFQPERFRWFVENQL